MLQNHHKIWANKKDQKGCMDSKGHPKSRQWLGEQDGPGSFKFLWNDDAWSEKQLWCILLMEEILY